MSLEAAIDLFAVKFAKCASSIAIFTIGVLTPFETTSIINASGTTLISYTVTCVVLQIFASFYTAFKIITVHYMRSITYIGDSAGKAKVDVFRTEFPCKFRIT